ncbi:TPA: hypothetical protein ENG04_12225, partial [Candidatus Poribacteria bacterium]|nr:hypothetical protein [Candidatus Poribacteria bacterium]HEX30836.1 hypothetical protein [Candidatus Poribacteria bacterium]
MAFYMTGLLLSLVFSTGLECERTLLESLSDPGDWTPQNGSPAAELSPDGHLMLKCRFEEGMDRCFWDKEIQVDLSRYGRFSLRISGENTDAISSGTIYFRSGDGWYGGWFPLREGRET